jgi:type VI secretion system secreted protein Hcp
MPSTTSPAATPGRSDIFLHLQAKRAGKVKGEAIVPGHENDIEVLQWNWGAAASSAIGSSQATARRTYSGLSVVKRIDSATTALLAALATNDEIKEARLVVRKSDGDEALDYFIVTLNNARVVAVNHATDEHGTTTEAVTLTFTKVAVEYRSQRNSGGRGASFVFQDEVHPAA